MTTFTNAATTTLFSAHNHHLKQPPPSSIPPQEKNAPTTSTSTSTSTTSRRKMFTTFLATTALSTGLGPVHGPAALAEEDWGARAEHWGTRSMMKEHFFMPDLSPEDSAARIKQTAAGMRTMREMLEAMAWRYCLFYIREKQVYLLKDLKIATPTVPTDHRADYVAAANELIDNVAMLDTYVRRPKVYESYVYYEKTLKSIDHVVSLLD